MDLTIIVVSHNTRDMTVECIKSVIEQTKRVRYELIVFDSGSYDDLVNAIRSYFPEIKLIASPEDVGFARANNTVATHARGRYLLLLNPDTIVTNNAIDQLYDFAIANPEYRIWGGRTIFPDGTLNPSWWRYPTLWRLFCKVFGLSAIMNSVFPGESYGAWKACDVRTVDIIAGCFFLIDRDLWNRLNGFDPIFFMFSEDADLCLRARKLGARPGFTPNATIIHYGGAAYPDKAEHYIETLTSRVTLMQRHWSAFTYYIGIMLLYILPLTQCLACSIVSLRGRPEYRQRARLWGQVWRKRHDWISGWRSAAINDSPNSTTTPTR